MVFLFGKSRIKENERCFREMQIIDNKDAYLEMCKKIEKNPINEHSFILSIKNNEEYLWEVDDVIDLEEYEEESNMLNENVTGIVVTHNLDANMLKKYDEIIVLKQGEIIETGKFQELMENKNIFYSLFVAEN